MFCRELQRFVSSNVKLTKSIAEICGHDESAQKPSGEMPQSWLVKFSMPPTIYHISSYWFPVVRTKTSELVYLLPENEQILAREIPEGAQAFSYVRSQGLDFEKRIETVVEILRSLHYRRHTNKIVIIVHIVIIEILLIK